MSLGETIYRLRTERKLSQGDLADALNVSRQSISKWETNSSVPELDKLVKLSELFDVTLDELVRGEPPRPAPEAPPATPTVVIQQAAGLPPGRTAGIILLCAAAGVILICTLLGGALEGLFLSLPFLTCGLICMLCSRRAGLWCGWAVFCLADLYLRFATGVNWRLVWRTLPYTPKENYFRLGIAWGQLLCLLLLLGLTLFSFRKTQVRLSGGKKWLLAGGWAALIALRLLFNQIYRYAARSMILADWVVLPLFVALLTATFCWGKTKRANASRKTDA